MSNPVRLILLFLLLLFVQVFLLRQISIGYEDKEYIFLFVIPLFVALQPLRTPRPLVVLAGFAIGLGTDFFYETLGLHAAAGTFAGYVRQFALRFIEPKDGYKVKSTTEGRELGRNWWVSYLLMLITAYTLFYFSMEAFSHVFWLDILLKTICTTVVSWVFCTAVVLFFEPRI